MGSDGKRARRGFEGASLLSEEVLLSFGEGDSSGERRNLCLLDKQHPVGSGGNQSWRRRC